MFCWFFHLKGHAETSNWDLISKTLWNLENRCPYFLKENHKKFFQKKQKKTLTSVISLWLAGSTIRSIDWEFPMPSPQANSMNDNKYLSRPRGAINFPCYIEHSIHSHWDNNNTQNLLLSFVCLSMNFHWAHVSSAWYFRYITCSTTWSKIVQSVMLHLLYITDLTCD